MSSQDAGEYFKELDGRKFNNNSETTYILPADETEFERLNKQHNAFLAAMEGLYPIPDLVERVLAEKDGVARRILDVGCGSGAWALAMAQKFPHAQVYGLDLIPAPAANHDPPPNVHFEVGDINQGPRHFENSCDFLQMRCVGAGLPDYPEAINHVARCLKEGGLLIILDGDPWLCGEDIISAQRMYTENQRDGSWMHRYYYEFMSAYESKGMDVFKTHMNLDKGIWGHPLLEQCGAGNIFLPLGPWAAGAEPAETQRLKVVGELMRQNLKNFVHALATVMKERGVQQEFLDRSMAEAVSELDELRVHSWIRLRLLWGFRKRTSTAESNEEMRSSWNPNRQIHIYHSSEEMQAAKQRWLDTTGEIPVSQVEIAKGKGNTILI